MLMPFLYAAIEAKPSTKFYELIHPLYINATCCHVTHLVLSKNIYSNECGTVCTVYTRTSQVKIKWIHKSDSMGLKNRFTTEIAPFQTEMRHLQKFESILFHMCTVDEWWYCCINVNKVSHISLYFFFFFRIFKRKLNRF